MNSSVCKEGDGKNDDQWQKSQGIKCRTIKNDVPFKSMGASMAYISIISIQPWPDARIANVGK